MNRRDFLKSALTLTALAPLGRLVAQPLSTSESKISGSGKKVTRRRYKNSAITLPLLGFGMMRLPRVTPGRPEIDYKATKKMFDRAFEAGVNYFDTAYFYHSGLSEKAAGDILSQYPRESYYLADKMPIRALRKKADLERIWQEQLTKTKAGYFDFYLLHNLTGRNWKTVIDLQVYDFLKQKQKEGKIKHLGFSFHDKPEVLKTIANAYQWDFAQIQLNYLDWKDYRSKEQYEILTKLNIPVIVMEPLRGGVLANLNQDAAKIFTNSNPNVSVASWAFRYVGSLSNVFCILSGMTQYEHLEDNIKTFTDFKPLNASEQKVVRAALSAYKKTGAISCTDCRYCMPCPAGVNIPGVFELYNEGRINGKSADYSKLTVEERASACVSCGICKKKCPQHLDIPELMKRISSETPKKG